MLGESLFSDAFHEFINLRAKTFFIDKGFRYDEAEAVLKNAKQSLPEALDKIDLIHTYREKEYEYFKLIVETANRVKKLSQNASATTFNKQLCFDLSEQEALIFIRSRLINLSL